MGLPEWLSFFFFLSYCAVVHCVGALLSVCHSLPFTWDDCGIDWGFSRVFYLVFYLVFLVFYLGFGFLLSIIGGSKGVCLVSILFGLV